MWEKVLIPVKKVLGTIKEELQFQLRLKRVRSDPIFFSKFFLNFKPFPYQAEVLADESRRIVACMGRQTGKSTTIAAKAVWFAITKPSTTTLIVSATMRQSMLMMDKIISLVKGSGPLKESVRYDSRTRIQFKNGSWIIALPCGRFGSTLRGHTAHLVILDECSFIPEEVVTNVVLPMISTTNGCVWMLSTPWDKDHVFYKCFLDSAGWSVYHLPSRANPLIKPEFLEEQRKLIGEERFQMEYEANFVDDTKSFFPMTLIRPCIEDYTPNVENNLNLNHFGGYDPGGKNTPAALVIVARNHHTTTPHVLKVNYLLTEMSETYTEFSVKAAEISNQARVEKWCVDSTGTQGAIVEHLKELGVNTEGITLTDRKREEVLMNLRIVFEQRRITIPHDRDLINALNCVEYNRTRLGGYRFYHRTGTHDDLAFALALACWAAKEGSLGTVVY